MTLFEHNEVLPCAEKIT